MADLFAGFTTFLFTFDSGGVKMSGGANREQPMTAFSLCAHTVLEDTCRFLASRLLRCRNSRRDDASASPHLILSPSSLTSVLLSCPMPAHPRGSLSLPKDPPGVGFVDD